MCGLEKHPEVSASSPSSLEQSFPFSEEDGAVKYLCQWHRLGWFGLLRMCLVGAMACSV